MADLKCPESAEGLEELEKLIPLCRKEIFQQVRARVETGAAKSEREAERQVAEELGKPVATIRTAVQKEMVSPKVDYPNPLPTPKLTQLEQSEQRFILKVGKEIKKERRQERQRVREEQKAEILEKDPPLQDERYRLFLHDFRTSEVESSSIDAIITDPPYGFDFLPLYKDLSVFAARVLKPDAPCIVMTGQSWLETVLNLLSSNLNYVWTLAYFSPGKSTQIFGRKIKSNWKPVIFMVNGKNECEHIEDWVNAGKYDKRFHDWGQTVEGMSQIVEKFTIKGDMILDPFCGAGTTGLAALGLDRFFIGIDTDEYAIKQTGERLKEFGTRRVSQSEG